MNCFAIEHEELLLFMLILVKSLYSMKNKNLLHVCQHESVFDILRSTLAIIGDYLKQTCMH